MKLPPKPPELQFDEDQFRAHMDLWRPEIEGAYLPWDELRHRPPPAGLGIRAWWNLIAGARLSSSRDLPLNDVEGLPFRLVTPDSVLRLLHGVDRDASGRIELPEQVTTAPMRDRYIVNSLMEEAITSSQLEGASTTRQVAKEMLRSGRAPRTTDEKMILNNYLAMQWVRDRRDRAITPALVLELHGVVTRDTLDGGPDGAGRFRRADENIVVVSPEDDEILHTPPAARELPDRMEALCRFAAGANDEGFIHPVVRAILLHFWIGHDHPFVDGNGRTARALFYWSMAKEGYWLTEFLSISRLLRKAPAKYARAYLHAEAERDATYFVLHQLHTIRQAIDDLTTYLKRKTREVRETEHVIKHAEDLNHRQIALIGHALRHPDAEYTIEGHRRSHAVVYDTARRDLMELVERRWFEQRKRGRAFVYVPTDDLARRVGGKSRR